MALNATTLASAVGITDNVIVVASATGFAAGNYIRVDQELMRVTNSYAAGSVTVPVIRGQDGTATAAHVSSAKVQTELASDIGASAPQAVTQLANYVPRVIRSYSANGAIALPTVGNDMIAFLNGTSTLAMTLANPTTDMDGSLLFIISNGKGAHTVTYSAGVGNGGGTMDVGTYNTTEATGCILIAANGFWVLIANGIGSAGTQVAGVVWA
jgi:hypothetical protein